MSLSELPRSLQIKIKATHFDFINKNFLFYTDNAVSKGAKTWTKPFNRPQLIGHDTKSDPIGRVVDYDVIRDQSSKDEPGNYILLTVNVTDQKAIEKILDGRYYTVSVGSRSSRVLCSECKQVITEDGLCEHKKGSINERGRPIYWIVDQIEYTEDSFVNEPADEYTGITEILINNKWVTYKAFLDNQEISMEDKMIDSDAKLTVEQRAKLPESFFCGPNRSFPAHDEAHIKAGLELLGTANVSDSLKSKIKASLYRKGMMFGVVPSTDASSGDFDILYRMEDNFSDEEIKEIADWFVANPDSDLPKEETATLAQTDSTSTTIPTIDKDISKMKKEELVDVVKSLQTTLKTIEDNSKKSIEEFGLKKKELEDKVQSLESIALQKEDELNKYIDKFCVLEKKYKDAIISNILDLKLADNMYEERQELTAKLIKRSVESLVDSLTDLRIEKLNTAIHSDNRVTDPTQNIENKDQSSATPANEPEQQTEDPRFKVFSIDKTEVN